MCSFRLRCKDGMKQLSLQSDQGESLKRLVSCILLIGKGLIRGIGERHRMGRLMDLVIWHGIRKMRREYTCDPGWREGRRASLESVLGNGHENS